MGFDLIHEQLLQNAADATGNGASFDAGPVGVNDVVLQVVISNTATVTFEATVDGTNWIAIQGTNLNSGSAATSATASGLFRFNVSGLHQLRARISAYTSGTVTVHARGQA